MEKLKGVPIRVCREKMVVHQIFRICSRKQKVSESSPKKADVKRKNMEEKIMPQQYKKQRILKKKIGLTSFLDLHLGFWPA